MNDGLILEGKRLHGDAHISPEVFSQLENFIHVGNPRDWMKSIMEGGTGLYLNDLPPEFVDSRREFTVNFELINKTLNAMTAIVNGPDPLSEDNRRIYQENERALMQLVIDASIEHFGEPQTTKLILALRGAKFFEIDFEQYAGSKIEVEAKRVRLEEVEGVDGSEFYVGLGHIDEPDEAEILNTKVLIMPDDCLSTGMTQTALLEQLLTIGYMPEKVVMCFTVATTAGIQHVYNEFERIKEDHGIETQLILQCGGFCFSVNEAMYLLTHDDRLQVGDMGAQNELVPTYKPIVSSVNPGGIPNPGDVDLSWFQDIGPDGDGSKIPGWKDVSES